MTKIDGKKFVFTECHIDSQGDRIWNVSPIDSFSFPEFLIHVSSNNHLYVTIFKSKYKKTNGFINVNLLANCLKKICRHVYQETHIPPTLKIKPPNNYLFTACERAGMKHSPLDRTVMIFKV